MESTKTLSLSVWTLTQRCSPKLMVSRSLCPYPGVPNVKKSDLRQCTSQREVNWSNWRMFRRCSLRFRETEFFPNSIRSSSLSTKRFLIAKLVFRKIQQARKCVLTEFEINKMQCREVTYCHQGFKTVQSPTCNVRVGYRAQLRWIFGNFVQNGVAECLVITHAIQVGVLQFSLIFQGMQSELIRDEFQTDSEMNSYISRIEQVIKDWVVKELHISFFNSWKLYYVVFWQAFSFMHPYFMAV